MFNHVDILPGKKGIQVKVFASCQLDQVPSSLMYSARGCARILELQQSGFIEKFLQIRQPDFTEITCGKSWDEECAFSPDFTFHRRRETNRIFLVKGTDRGRKIWCYVLLVRDYTYI